MNVSRLVLAAAVLALGACSTMPPVQTAQAAPISTRVTQVVTDSARVQLINDAAARQNVLVYWLSYPQKVTVVTGPSTN
jgi:Ni,Fe-hydrogenase I small subunit